MYTCLESLDHNDQQQQGVIFVVLKRSSGKVLKRHVRLAVEGDERPTELIRITWFSEIMPGGLEWAGSCVCHEDLSYLKIMYDCPEKKVVGYRGRTSGRSLSSQLCFTDRLKNGAFR